MGVMGIARKPKNVSWHGLHSKNLVLESDSQQLWGLGGTRPWNLTRGAATCCMLPPPPPVLPTSWPLYMLPPFSPLWLQFLCFFSWSQLLWPQFNFVIIFLHSFSF